MRLPCITASLLVVALPLAAGAKTPLERTSDLVDAFKQVKVAKEGETLTAADKDANRAVFKKLDDFFDFQLLTTEPLVPHRAKLTADQQTKVKSMFGELIRLVAYPKSGNFLRDAQYKLKAGPKPDEVTMDASMPKEDFKTSVIFRWKQHAGSWRIVDVSFDGSSLIKDYTNQFGRIIDKDGAEGLVKKLTSRLEKERQKQGA
jgi:ABC-type transporter MlaC component